LEPVTHFLTGACLGRSWFNRKTAFATATMALAAEAPDLDILALTKGRVFYFAHHRGFTHSFVGLIFVSAAVVGFMYLVWRVRGRKLKDPNLPPRWGLLFLFAYIAGLSHLLLDFTNSYGLRPFWPFSEHWYSWDIVDIFEPTLFILLLAGLILPALFGLINEEIGARRKGPRGQVAAILALAGVVAIWAVRDYEHRRAVYAMEARVYRYEDAIRVSAFPYEWDPFRWYGVVEAQDFFATMHVDSASPEVDPDARMRIYYKPAETPITLAAKKSYLGRVYLDWAQYPLVQSEALESPQKGYVVYFQDLRYAYPERTENPLGADELLDKHLNVIKAEFGFSRKLQTAQISHPGR
jgi:inner membrane protein